MPDAGTTARPAASWRRRIIYALLMLALLLGVLQLAASFIMPRIIEPSMVDPPYSQYFHPELLYLHPRHCLSEPRLPCVTIFGRGRPVKLLVLGDSVSFGIYLSQKQRYSEVLARKLAARHEGLQVWDINPSLWGYTAFQGLRLAQMLIPSIRPQFVILAYGINDAQRATRSDREWLELLRGPWGDIHRAGR